MGIKNFFKLKQPRPQANQIALQISNEAQFKELKNELNFPEYSTEIEHDEKIELEKIDRKKRCKIC